MSVRSPDQFPRILICVMTRVCVLNMRCEKGLEPFPTGRREFDIEAERKVLLHSARKRAADLGVDFDEVSTGEPTQCHRIHLRF